MPTRRHVLATLAALGVAPSAFAQLDSASGIRQMLTAATRAATDRLGRHNGFFADSIVRIPLPGILGTTQRRLQPLGLAGPLDDLELRMNRAAESVMPAARDLVTGAIGNLSLSDGIGILRGGDTAATDYLERETAAPLGRLLRPPMETTLAQSGAYAALDSAASLVSDNRSGIGRLFGRSRGNSLATGLRGEVTDFAVTRALDGVFHYVGEEERGFRRNPLGRSEDILRGLFGRRP
ncbi:DUF4197 domain-containing protein [Hyphobacterium marinum]|uniref:DUF4197 domain-containing protein n=1 Tax=Hyphobacterium marinum TaxID=3116574 RepID=A0ABU7LWD8_9PROT|nr:DUF4197 domain-containing protein [Hyphobacterium sp. Y6023]MEE2565874.1 DUF4197 domain-containing protein [Hyphobacterium sp. Y6023]